MKDVQNRKLLKADRLPIDAQKAFAEWADPLPKMIV